MYGYSSFRWAWIFKWSIIINKNQRKKHLNHRNGIRWVCKERNNHITGMVIWFVWMHFVVSRVICVFIMTIVHVAFILNSTFSHSSLWHYLWNAFEFGSCEHDFGWKTLDFSTRVTNSHSNHFSYTFAVMFITIACDLSFTSDRLESKKKCFVWQEHVKWLNVRCSMLFVKGLAENVKSQWTWTCGTQQVFIHINHRTFLFIHFMNVHCSRNSPLIPTTMVISWVYDVNLLMFYLYGRVTILLHFIINISN